MFSHACEDRQAALQVPEQRMVHSSEIANPRYQAGKLTFNLRRALFAIERAAGVGNGVPSGLSPELVFELAPLAAEFRLACRAAGDRLRIVADERVLTGLK